jgi:hypothetical protein
MKSNLVSASVLAVSALAFFGSASSFAEGRDPFPQDQSNTVSSKTRAEVRAELLQAQREGYSVNVPRNYQAPEASAPVSTKSRAEVKAEAGNAVSVSTLERDYPVVQ